MTLGTIGFVLCSNLQEPMPSTRIAVLNMLPFLHDAGLQTHILFQPDSATETPDLTGVAERTIEAGCDVVVLQKVVGPSAISFTQKMREHGIRTIFAVCDRIDVDMAAVADITIVISDFLKSLYPAALQSRIHVVHDGIENPDVCKTDWGTHRSGVEAVLVTSHDLSYLPVIETPPPWLKLRIVGRYRQGLKKINDIRWKWAEKEWDQRKEYLKFLTNRQIECVPWGAESVYRDMQRADIGLIPINTPAPATQDAKDAQALPPEWMRKSENRLTLKMSVGLPVIATPIPSYEALIDNGVNGFLARSKEDWGRYLEMLRDPERRREIGLAARDSVATRFSMKSQAEKFIHLLRSVQTDAPRDSVNYQAG
jgi:glycosyltransferase involved in cell wall biosynthesis